MLLKNNFGIPMFCVYRFNYTFQSVEEEFADALMDVKNAIEDVRKSQTLRQVLGTLLAIGNFLNGREVEAFDLEYLTRVVDVKDTLNKTPLMLHLVEMVVEKFPEASDLYSDLPHLHRVAKVSWTHTHTKLRHVLPLSLNKMDWGEQEHSLEKLSKDLSQSWEHLRTIAKHETFTDSISTEKKMKSAEFLTEAAGRLKVLEVIHRRVINRFNRLYLFMGMSPGKAENQKVREEELEL